MSNTGQRKLEIWEGGGLQTNIFDIVLGQYADDAVSCLGIWQEGD